ncbi:precorrin-2 C(20)-methyltransferase [Mycoplasma sp. P36-A1]|uniref:precorrin-2 C(20)-methyltransferase n=1 Tax=Mycoplasma sp. P36-A1 TaxID=3252900 RepID=UPI003C2D0D11
MKGKLYGVGIGPGDAKLLTLKAVEVLKEVDVVVIPQSKNEQSTAYNIVKEHIPTTTEIVGVHTAMSKTHDRNKMYEKAANTIDELLASNKNVAFITLGDPTVYSTYMYIHKIIQEKGYNVEIIPGITSFTAAAAALNTSLCEHNEQLHIIPSTYGGYEQHLQLDGNKVLMKNGKELEKVIEYLKTNNDKYKTSIVEKVSMKDEKIYEDIMDAKDIDSYFTLLIVKERN